MAIIGCLVGSVMRMILNSCMANSFLMMFTMVQGTWLIHSAFIDSSEKMIYLYFSWHMLAIFILNLVINVITQLCVKTQVKKHKVAKHKKLATSVDRISEVHSDTGTGLTVVPQDDADSDDNYKEIIITKKESCDYEKQLNKEQEIFNVLEMIDIMVREQATIENNTITAITNNHF